MLLLDMQMNYFAVTFNSTVGPKIYTRTGDKGNTQVFLLIS